MKEYLKDTTPIIILVIPIYIILIYSILSIVYKKMLIKDKFNKIYLFIVVFFYLAIYILDIKFNFIPYFNDTKTYAEIISTGGYSGYQAWEVVTGFKYISFVFRVLAFNSVALYIPLNFMINHLGIIFLWRAWLEYKEFRVYKSSQRIYLCLTMIYPMSIINSLVPLREAYFTLFFAIFLTGIINKKLLNINFIIGVLGIFLLRREYLIIAIIFLSIKIYIKVKVNKKIIKDLVFIIIFALVMVGISNITRSIFNIDITPRGLANFRNYQSRAYATSGLVYPFVNWRNWGEVMLDIPALIIQFALAPLPILVKNNPVNTIVYLIDSIFVGSIILVKILNIKKLKNNGLWIFLILIILTMNSSIEYYLTGAVRHRYIAVLLIICVISYIWSWRKNEIRDITINNEL